MVQERREGGNRGVVGWSRRKGTTTAADAITTTVAAAATTITTTVAAAAAAAAARTITDFPSTHCFTEHQSPESTAFGDDLSRR